MKKSRKSRKSRKKNRTRQQQALPNGNGFELGLLPRVMAFAGDEFNQSFIDAQVVGCSYSLVSVADFPSRVPELALIASKPDRIIDAFNWFKKWGSDEDGDVVGLAIRFNSDGSYDLGIGPNTVRHSLSHSNNWYFHDLAYMGISWVKHMDSTQEILRDIAKYADGPFAPFYLSVCQLNGNSPPTRSSLSPIEEVTPILKYEISVVREGDGKYFPNMMGGEEVVVGNTPDPDKSRSPESVASNRKTVLKNMFPITVANILKSELLQLVRSEFAGVALSNDQILQAAINCIVSQELCDDSLHYREFGDQEMESVWEYLFQRIEVPGEVLQKNIPRSADVAVQLQLDVRSVMRQRGVPAHNLNFEEQQKIFLDKGYSLHD